MWMRRIFAITLLVSAAVPLLAAEPWFARRARTRPECLSGIPSRDYQYGTESATRLAISKRGVLVEKTEQLVEEIIEQIAEQSQPATTTQGAGGAASRVSAAIRAPESLPTPARQGRAGIEAVVRDERHKIRLFQLDEARLAINQCSISRVAVQLHSDGVWVLNLRADQNPRYEGPGDPPYNPLEYIKRNRFHVSVRCYGAFDEAEALPLTIGKPELANLGTTKFWVENGRPYFVRASNKNDDVKDYFHLIDRVEVEFSFEEVAQLGQ